MTDFRSRQPQMLLPSNGFPEERSKPSPLDHKAVLSTIEGIEKLLDFMECYPSSQIGSPKDLTIVETRRAWNRWIGSHHIFMPTFGLAAVALNRATAAAEASNYSECQSWVGYAARLRRLQAAMILYGVDFEPAGLLFTHEVRTKKPEGLSGLEMRERHDCYMPAVSKFHRAFRMMNADFNALAAVFAKADARYADCHTQCMQKVLPTPDGSRPESLRKKYMEKFGKARPLDDETFSILDGFFQVVRTEKMPIAEYTLEFCSAMGRLVNDLLLGHRLDRTVLTEIVDGGKSAFYVLRQPLGPVAE
jgi:hypothetical protein